MSFGNLGTRDCVTPTRHGSALKACPRARWLTIDQPSSGISATARRTSSEREAGLRRGNREGV
jgi:hypothetical protein